MEIGTLLPFYEGLWWEGARGGVFFPSVYLSLWDAPVFCLSVAAIMDATSVCKILVNCAFHFVCTGCSFRFA